MAWLNDDDLTAWSGEDQHLHDLAAKRGAAIAADVTEVLRDEGVEDPDGTAQRLLKSIEDFFAKPR